MSSMNYELLGILLTLVLMALTVALFILIDRREMLRLVKTFALMGTQVAVLGGSVWLVFKVDTWWVHLLWLVVMLLLALAWCLRETGRQWKRLLLPVAAAMVAGILVGGGCLMLALPWYCFVPVTGVLLAHLMVAVTQTIQTYERSLLHTEIHRRYLLANGATRLESLLPCVRRALRASVQPQLKTMAQPLIVAMPLLFAGMLLGGVSPADSVIAVLLVAAAAFVTTVVAAVVAIAVLFRLSR